MEIFRVPCFALPTPDTSLTMLQHCFIKNGNILGDCADDQQEAFCNGEIGH